MAETKPKRLKDVIIELNVGSDHIVDFLSGKGIKVDNKPTTKITPEAYQLLLEEFQSDKIAKAEKEQAREKIKHEPVTATSRPSDGTVAVEAESDEDLKSKLLSIKKEAAEKTKKPALPAGRKKEEPEVIKAKVDKAKPKVVGKIELEETKTAKGKKSKSKKASEAAADESVEVPADETPSPEKEVLQPEEEKKVDFSVKDRVGKLSGPTIIGKIELKEEKPKQKESSADGEKKKRKRKDKKVLSSGRMDAAKLRDLERSAPRRDRPIGEHRRDPRAGRAEPSEKEIQDQIKATLDRLRGTTRGKSGAKHRKAKRTAIAERQEQAIEQLQQKVIKVTEFVSANELANMIGVPVTDIISKCMELGMFVSINQRLDAETLSVVSEEFGYKVEFVAADVLAAISDQPDNPEDLEPRPPIVTVMGHVDHGKTSLLDYVRSANVVAGEAGGITQHIGAYEVTLDNGKEITFLDTPGHEAFTAMRARGAKVTDVAIIVIAADDNVMPQTVEAINHAQAAQVPIVFALNKIDKADANPDKVKEQLSKMNILVEDWGGKYQCQPISAKKGTNVDTLLEKVLLEAELLDLKANHKKNAVGTVIESTLDRGRGYVTNILVQSGSLEMGDVILAGCYSGRVKAMFNERGQKIEKAGPSTPVMILGLSGAPQAGDQFNVMDDEREAREIANKRLQLQREQGIRTHKHITLDEIGRRLAIGNFKELNVIVKGDVDGSVEALADSLLKLSSGEIQVNVIHKSVGQITESDVMLASASNAIIIGFQVRPSMNARKLAEVEQIDIRLYSIIYDAINEVKAAMEGMLAPEYQEKITCNIEVREVFKIPKAGTVAGCMVTDGKITRNTAVRVIRDGIVIYSGVLASLKRFKDDVKEVTSGYECGLNIANFNDIKAGDNIEGYEQVAVKRVLA